MSIVFLAGLIGAGAARADSGKEARELRKQYDALRKETDLHSGIKRWTLLRKLGTSRSDVARKALAQILRRRTTLAGEKLLAATQLATVADLAAIQALAKRLKDPIGPFPVAVSYGLLRNTNPAVVRWVADEGLTKSGTAMQTACAMTLGWRKSRTQATADALAAVYHANKERLRDERIAVLVYETVSALARHPVALAKATLEDAAAHSDWRVRLAAVRFARAGLLADPNDIVGAAAARAVGTRDKKAIPALIDLLERPGLRAKRAAYDALKRIAGKDLGLDPGAWRSWHKRESQPGDRKPGPVTVSRYYGFEVLSERALFLVDVSGSMAWPETGTQRIDVARSELIGVLGKLGERTHFNVVVFHGGIKSWKREKLAPATPANVEKATGWIREGLALGHGTNVSGALDAAFQHDEVDTIFLLGDGAPNHEPSFAIEARVHAWNRFRRVVIHTIALTLHERGKLSDKHIRLLTRFMERLASITNGEYRLVSDLPGSK